MNRITLKDDALSMMVKMAEGNPGAITAMAEIIKHHNDIDPQSMLGGLGEIMMLDEYGIYGTDIYILWNDKCGRDVRLVCVIMRAVQLGFFPKTRLCEMAHDQTRSINLTEEEFTGLDNKVCERLDDFAKPADQDKAA